MDVTGDLICLCVFYCSKYGLNHEISGVIIKMCGISLIYNTDGQSVDKRMLTRMTLAIKHRGPDADGVFINKHAGLGHTRLSIVDVQGGAQPMLSQDKRYVITYNGEIYNFRELRESLVKQGVNFESQCDTEVILALYQKSGTECVKQLRGMFSFAILEIESGKLFIARDRLGIKPLFYHWNGTTLFAASEIKSLFASKMLTPVMNKQSIRNYFTYQFSVPPYTMFENVLELPPGHTLIIEQAGKPDVKEYWDLEFPEESCEEQDEYLIDENFNEENENKEEQEWIKKFETTFHDAAKCHTIGDVPIGTYLSGGIDSSATTLLLKQHYPSLPNSFSIHFTNPLSDESYAYKPVANHLGVPNFELLIDDEREDGYLGVLEKCLYHLEQPQRMAVDIPHFLLSDFVRQHNCKVVYTGDGADEILGGYDCFRQDGIRCWGNELQNEEVRSNHYLTEYTKYFSVQYMQMLITLHKPEKQQQVYEEFGTYPAWYDMWQVLKECSEELFTESFLIETNNDTQMPELVARMKPKIENRHPLNQSLYIETKTRLPGWILWKSDRLSMANSVEARIPFMDHPLVELSANMPCYLKLNGMDEKYALKMIMKPALPEIPGEYKKRAFYTPIREWFFSKNRQTELQKYISIDALEEVGFFKPDVVQDIVKRLTEAPSELDINSSYDVMKDEWLFMLVLSTQILYAQFIKQSALCFRD